MSEFFLFPELSEEQQAEYRKWQLSVYGVRMLLTMSDDSLVEFDAVCFGGLGMYGAIDKYIKSGILYINHNFPNKTQAARYVRLMQKMGVNDYFESVEFLDRLPDGRFPHKAVRGNVIALHFDGAKLSSTMLVYLGTIYRLVQENFTCALNWLWLTRLHPDWDVYKCYLLCVALRFGGTQNNNHMVIDTHHDVTKFVSFSKTMTALKERGEKPLTLQTRYERVIFTLQPTTPTMFGGYKWNEQLFKTLDNGAMV